MAKKRKSEAPGLEEVERTLYTSFSAAANSISQLYTQAQNQQKIAFQAGHRHSLDKVHQWISREHNGAAYISVEQLMTFLQKENDRTEEAMPPLTVNHSFSVSSMPGLPLNNNAAVGHSSSDGSLLPHFDPSKASVFVGALSSPQRRSMPQFEAQPALDHDGGLPLSDEKRSENDGGRRIDGHYQHNFQNQQRQSVFGQSTHIAGSILSSECAGQQSGQFCLQQQQQQQQHQHQQQQQQHQQQQQQQQQTRMYNYGMGQEARGNSFLNDNDSSMDTYSR